MKTNAARMLDAARVAYRLMQYEIDEENFNAATAADKLGLPAASVFKTLVLKGDRTGPLVICLPADLELNLKSAAAASGNKSVAMVPVSDILSLTGYVRGGVSPLGMKKKFPTFIHHTVLELDQVGISGGKWGLEIVLSGSDLIAVTQAKTADLGMPRP